MTKGIRDPRARDRVVTAARQSIADLGIRGATVRAIATEAGVSTGYVMHYFADKDEIAQSVLDETNRIARERVEKAVIGREGLDRVRAVVDAMLPLKADQLLDWRVWVAFWSQAQGSTTAQGGNGLADASLRFGAMLVEALQSAVAAKELPKDIDVLFEAGRLVTITAGLGLMSGTNTTAEIKKVSKRMLDTHFADLKARS